jgi:uncharacterized RDD family membrane protein YckC
MSCPICGEICRCATEIRRQPAPRLVDPEAYDASEQQFAASLEGANSSLEASGPLSQLEFVRNGDTKNISSREAAKRESPPRQSGESSATDESRRDDTASRGIDSPTGHDTKVRGVDAHIDTLATALSEPSIFQEYQDPAAWKQELAAKLNEYRSRHRPRAPRYPSLQLKFEASEPGWTTPLPAHESDPSTFATRQATALDSVAPISTPEAVSIPAPRPASPESGRIIEFPRAVSIPSSWVNELAEPVMERPRILDVPEVTPPLPALGGILIEPVQKSAEEKRPGIEIPMLAVEMWRRLLAGALDGAFVVAAVALFGYVFSRMTGFVPPLRPAAIGAALLTAFFWIGYHYLLIVHSGTTPGLKLAGLELSRFDGSGVPRHLRRWRVLASVMSGASLCLGYAWCLLDEDQLCWHDRITKTYMAPKP